jgi:hypothetical protein
VRTVILCGLRVDALKVLKGFLLFPVTAMIPPVVMSASRHVARTAKNISVCKQIAQWGETCRHLTVIEIHFTYELGYL